jgi:hypothetical protein
VIRRSRGQVWALIKPNQAELIPFSRGHVTYWTRRIA